MSRSSEVRAVDGVAVIFSTVKNYHPPVTLIVCIIRCVYRAELILGRLFTYRIRIPDLKYQFIKVRLRYINVHMDGHGQLSVGSARVSHFVDAETCEFPSLSDSISPWYLNLTFIN